MAAEDGLFHAEVVEQADEVARQVLHVVGFDGVRSLGQAIAAHVRGDGPAAGGLECVQLMAPGEGEFGEAVAQDDRNAFARANLVIGHLDVAEVGKRDLRHLGFEGGHREVCSWALAGQ